MQNLAQREIPTSGAFEPEDFHVTQHYWYQRALEVLYSDLGAECN